MGFLIRNLNPKAHKATQESNSSTSSIEVNVFKYVPESSPQLSHGGPSRENRGPLAFSKLPRVRASSWFSRNFRVFRVVSSTWL
jgi:hypothetical protein